MQLLPIDQTYVQDVLFRLLSTPSPSGYTDRVVHLVADELDKLGVGVEVTRRGAIRANLKGQRSSPDRAVVAHIDTLGAMVKSLKPNGRVELIPIGHWNARFAEGARVTLFTDMSSHRGTIHDVTDKLDPALRKAAVAAAAAIDIPVTGLDFMVPAPDSPDYVIIEANERPGLANHEPQPTAERFIDLLFPSTAGR